MRHADTAGRKSSLRGRAVTLVLALLALPLGGTASPVEAGRDTSRLRPNGHSPELNYRQYCSGCHLEDGSGAPAKGIPNMRGVLGHFLRVEGGREFIVRVPGVSHTPLADADVAELMNWLLSGIAQPSLPAQAEPYTAAEIGRLRRTRMVDIPGTRAGLVARLREAGYPLGP